MKTSRYSGHLVNAACGHAITEGQKVEGRLWCSRTCSKRPKKPRVGLSPKAKEYQRRYMNAKMRANRDYIEDYKSNEPCADCGQRFPNICLDFDHVRGSKKFNISQGLLRSRRALNEELAKCEIVCSNCHRIRTQERRQATTEAKAESLIPSGPDFG